jgi:hypothetical protein
MINDIGTFTEDTPYKPWIICWPLKPVAGAPQQFANRCPSMHRQIAIAAIYCDYQGLYQSLNIRPNAGLMEVAEQVGNPFYRLGLEKRAAEFGINDISDEQGPMILPGDESRHDGFEYT